MWHPDPKKDPDLQEDLNLIWDPDHWPKYPDPTWWIPKCQKELDPGGPDPGSLISPPLRVGSIPGVWVTRSRLFCNFSGVGVTPFPKRVISRRLCDFHNKLCALHDGLREMMMSHNLLCKSWKLLRKSRNLLESTQESQLQHLESESESESLISGIDTTLVSVMPGALARNKVWSIPELRVK